MADGLSEKWIHVATKGKKAIGHRRLKSQRRGLLFSEYKGTALAENLGLKHPKNQNVLAKYHMAAATYIIA